MKRIFVTFSLLMVFSFTSAVAAPINMNFSDYPGAPSTTGQVDLDTIAANTWFNTNYGVTFSGVYLYWDDRDAFDHIGIANDIGGSGIGTVNFSDTTNFVTVDWTTILNQDINLEAYDASNTLLDSFFADGSGTLAGTTTLNGIGINRLVFHDGGGQVGLSTLMYDYDGTTDGTNNDTDPVPEPGTMMLLGSGLVGLVGYGRLRLNK
jgi:hypothetical protein